MPFPFDEYPWAKFEDLNLAYMIHRLGLIISAADAKLTELDEWKTETEQDLENWKNSTMDLIAEWEHDFMADVHQWENETEQHLAQWKIDVLAELSTWKSNFETLFNQTFADLQSIKTAAENARDDAEDARDDAENARDAAAAAASSVSSSLEQITTNANNIDAIRGALNGDNGLISGSYSMIINASGVWTQPTARHARIKVSPGDIVRMVGGAIATAYGFLKSETQAVQNSNADFSVDTGYTSRIILNANADTGDITAPSDAALLYVAVLSNSNQDQAPASIKINGVELVYNIREKIDDILSEYQEIPEDIQNIRKTLKDIAYRSSLDIWGLRHNYEREHLPVSPVGFSFLGNIIPKFLFDGFSSIVSFDISDYKNTPGTIRTANPTSLPSVLSDANPGDEIHLSAGRYAPITITKSVNIIADEDGVVFSSTTFAPFDSTSTPGTYSTHSQYSLSSPYPVLIDYSDPKNPKELRRITGVSNVGAQPGTWCYSPSVQKVYIHLYDGVPDENNVIAADGSSPIIKMTDPVANNTVYIEGINVYGGTPGIHMEDKGSYNSQKLLAKNCRFMYSKGKNNVSLFGVTGYFQECESSFAMADGFNYHKNSTSENPTGNGTDTLAHGLEISCIAHDNGIQDTSENPSNNGSTVHNGGKVLRINGAYYHNNGGNVADTNSGTESFNYSCDSFDSSAPLEGNSADFWANYSAVVNLYGCRAVTDSASAYNLMALNGASIHQENTEYTTSTGTITP